MGEGRQAGITQEMHNKDELTEPSKRQMEANSNMVTANAGWWHVVLYFLPFGTYSNKARN